MSFVDHGGLVVEVGQSVWQRATRARWLYEDVRAGARTMTRARAYALAGDPAAAVLGLVGWLGRAAAYRWLP